MLKQKFKALLLILLVQPATAEVVLAPLFQAGAVLQRDRVVPVWGKADAGQVLTVTFAGQTKPATADAAGRWQVALDPMSASATERTMAVTPAGASSIEIPDLLVGEVWIGSGQSNMQWPVSKTQQADQDLAAKGPILLLRLFQVPMVLSHVRQDQVQAKWVAATPENSREFSAVSYFFGKILAEELKVPIGMIHSSWGGSRIEPWWAEEGLEGIHELADLRKQRLSSSPGFPEYDVPFRRFLKDVPEWSTAAEKAMNTGTPVPEMPTKPTRLKLGHGEETGLYQAMIHPLVPYAVRGFLWYQGESNNGEAMAYTTKMQALIVGWRKQFQNDTAPFLFVQLAPYNYGAGKELALPNIWWAQQDALKFPHTGMAVTNDIGDIKDIHPTQKAEVARRLSLWALADTYGRKDLVKSGPLFRSHSASQTGIAIKFDHTAAGLKTRDGQTPRLFEVAGKDGVFEAAIAQISADGTTLLLTSEKVVQPDRARFAWSQVAEPNLMNSAGLPAGAFHTHWPIDPTLAK